MSLVNKVKSRVARLRVTRPRLSGQGISGQTASVTGLGTQSYDPELAAIDNLDLGVARWRLGKGFGAPVVEPYAGQMVNLGLRKKLLATFPKLAQFPMVRKVLMR